MKPYYVVQYAERGSRYWFDDDDIEQYITEKAAQDAIDEDLAMGYKTVRFRIIKRTDEVVKIKKGVKK